MNGKVIEGLVPNTAVIDTFTAPDSMASRPNPGTLQDRPRQPFDEPATSIEANLSDD